MKGTIAICLQDLVKTKFGKDNWETILVKSGLPKDLAIYSHHDIGDDVIMKIVNNTCEVLGITLQQAADAFGEYWMTEYAPKKYFAFFTDKKTAKEFLLNMDKLHTKMTDKIENAKPPKFTYKEIDKNTIIMTYISSRNLEPIWIGLIKGVGKYFNENINIENLSENSVKITFD